MPRIVEPVTSIVWGLLFMKRCNKCGLVKSSDEFYKQPTGKSRLECKTCSKSIVKDGSRTVNGLINRIYKQQRERSRNKGYPQPKYTKQELKKWICQQLKFLVLYDNWVKSDYNKMLSPSVDRKDDYLPYAFGNIQLMTWEENKAKGHRDTRNGINNKRSKAVLQYTLSGEFIKEYYSACQAGRETDIYNTNISSNCRGKLKTAGGYIWKYKIDKNTLN